MKIYSKEQAESLLLKEDNECLNAIFEKCPQPMCFVSGDGYFIKPNEALCALVEYSYTELTQKRFIDITHPEDISYDLKELERLLDDKISHYVIFKRYITKSGRVVPLLVTQYKVQDEEGNLMYYVSHIVPIKNGSEENIRKWVLQYQTETCTNYKQKIGVWLIDNWKVVISILVMLATFAFFAIDFRTVFIKNYEIQQQLLEQFQKP